MDLTKITTPFGLLPPETQKALKEHGGPYEAYIIDGTWNTISQPQWQKSCAYRVRPEPPKPREIWVNVYPAWEGAHHRSREEADRAAESNRTKCVKFVEVIE